jgi:hypothetical protein
MNHFEKPPLFYNDVQLQGIHEHPNAQYPDCNWLKEYQVMSGADVENPDCFIMNIEDPDMPKIHRSENMLWYFRQNLHNEESHHFTVVRDPLNWLASYLASPLRTCDPQEAVGRYLHTLFWPCGRLISYNGWFLNEQYRRDIASAFGLEFTDAGKDKLPFPSSFDENMYADRASEMKVLDRYKHFLDNDHYMHMIQAANLVGISKGYFGFVPPELEHLS